MKIFSNFVSIDVQNALVVNLHAIMIHKITPKAYTPNKLGSGPVIDCLPENQLLDVGMYGVGRMADKKCDKVLF
jgi:hypothetical protein